MKNIALKTALLATTAATPLAAENRIDGQSPDAPELAAYGGRSFGELVRWIVEDASCNR